MATDARDLYGLALEEFVPARQALAKSLRQEGHREQARAVASRRKPSVAAWAVNQLVRTQRRDVEALFTAGDAVQVAQAELVAGRGDPGALRQAIADERDINAALVQIARGLLSRDGHPLSLPTLERVAQTLQAAALDEGARLQVSDACLERELQHVGMASAGLEADLATSTPAVASTPPKAPSVAGARARPASTARPRAPDAGQIRRARRAASEAEQAAQRAERDLAEAESRRDAAAGELKRAESELAEAQSHRDQCAGVLQRAGHELADARERVLETNRAQERARRALEDH